MLQTDCCEGQRILQLQWLWDAIFKRLRCWRNKICLPMMCDASFIDSHAIENYQITCHVREPNDIELDSYHELLIVKGADPRSQTLEAPRLGFPEKWPQWDSSSRAGSKPLAVLSLNGFAVEDLASARRTCRVQSLSNIYHDQTKSNMIQLNFCVSLIISYLKSCQDFWKGAFQRSIRLYLAIQRDWLHQKQHWNADNTKVS